jgi:hypothetical protein
MNSIKNLKLTMLVVPAILMGIYVAFSANISILKFAPNIAATLIGILFFIIIECWALSIKKNIFSISLVSLFIIFLSFFSHGLESVHRWIAIGPIFLNVSMVFVPVILYAMSTTVGLIPLILSIPLSIIFIFQPDAGQATAFALGSVIIFIFNHQLNAKVRIIGSSFAFFSTLLAWKSPDPLLPVKHVEQILSLALNNGILIFAITLISIFLLHLPFILAILKNSKLTISFLPLSYFVYLLTTFIVTQFGNFPVPIVGAGAASILGWFLMISFLTVASN